LIIRYDYFINSVNWNNKCILAVLIQNPKGGGIDSTFGGQGANQLFGVARSTDFIEKLTWGLIAALFILCIITAMFVTGSSEAVAPVTPQ
jgi:preprotein translocase subunit SecG